QNLKKSWHPQTLKNIERVWKAEQRHEAEVRKIEELQKELREERAREEIQRYAQETGAVKKKDDRLDWMYQGPGGQVSRDEYLLGRPIDRQITQQYEEPEAGPSTQTGLLPGSIFNAPPTTANMLDIAAKIREDPLFLIRKREEEKKREVLTNPVKMKKIKAMLQQNLDMKGKEKKKKKKDKKDKKEKEKKKRRKERRRKHSSSEDESSSAEEQRPRSERRAASPSLHASLARLAGYGLQLPSNGSRAHAVSPPVQQGAAGLARGRSRSRSCSPHKNSGHSSRQEKGKRGASPPAHSKHAHSDSRAVRRGRSPSPPKERTHKRHNGSHTKRLSAEELERRRKEMMDFARWRDEDRAGNVQRYQQEEERERKREAQTGHGQAGKFIHDMKLESASTSSLEDRVKRNIHSLQRTPAALEKNFMRR
ncbi:CWC25 factor, partial [Amia calva]|nr:CWC25 factor [Amia calva]